MEKKSLQATSGKLKERPEVKEFIMSELGAFTKVSEIMRLVKEKFGISISNVQIYNYKAAPKWQPIINKYRQKYMANMDDVPMSHKKVRLQRVEQLYEKSLKTDSVRDSLSTIEHSRKELEGDGNISFTLNQYNIMTDEEIEAKREWLLNKIKKTQHKEILDVEQIQPVQTSKD